MSKLLFSDSDLNSLRDCLNEFSFRVEFHYLYMDGTEVSKVHDYKSTQFIKAYLKYQYYVNFCCVHSLLNCSVSLTKLSSDLFGSLIYESFQSF